MSDIELENLPYEGNLLSLQNLPTGSEPIGFQDLGGQTFNNETHPDPPSEASDELRSPTGAYLGDGGQMSVEDVLALAYGAGFRGDDLIVAVAIAWRESRFKWEAVNDDRSTLDDSYGLWQVNILGNLAKGRPSADVLITPEGAAKAAFDLYTSGNSKRSAGTFYHWIGYRPKEAGRNYLSGLLKPQLASIASVAKQMGVWDSTQSARPGSIEIKTGRGTQWVGTGQLPDPFSVELGAPNEWRFGTTGENNYFDTQARFSPVGGPNTGGLSGLGSGLFRSSEDNRSSGGSGGVGSSGLLGAPLDVDQEPGPARRTVDSNEVNPADSTVRLDQPLRRNSVEIPSGGQVFHLDDGRSFVVYDFYDLNGPGVAYEINVESHGNFPEHQITADQFRGQDYVLGGSILELEGTQQHYGGHDAYQRFVQEVIDERFGPHNEAVLDPSILRVVLEVAGDQAMSPEELDRRLINTDYWRSRSSAALAWNDLAPTEQQHQIQTKAVQLQDNYFQRVGESKPVSFFYGDAEGVLSGVLSPGAWDSQVREVALRNPESPESRKIRQEGRDQLKFGVSVENTGGDLRRIGAEWGVQLGEQTLERWSTEVVNNVSSEDDFVDFVKRQAQVLYPWKDPERPTLEAAQPWMQTYERVMEKVPDIFNPTVQRALSGAMTQPDFESQLKGTEDWLFTKNAQETMDRQASSIGRRMGFV